MRETTPVIHGRKFLIPIFMNGIALREEQKFFPSFFQIFLSTFLAVILVILFLPLGAPAQRSEKESFSLFDRSTEEATLLNQAVNLIK